MTVKLHFLIYVARVFCNTVTLFSMGLHVSHCLMIIFHIAINIRPFSLHLPCSHGLGLTVVLPFSLLDIGLKQFDTATLLVKLAIPTVFLIACNLQVHYFQSPLLKLSQIDRYK